MNEIKHKNITMYELFFIVKLFNPKEQCLDMNKTGGVFVHMSKFFQQCFLSLTEQRGQLWPLYRTPDAILDNQTAITTAQCSQIMITFANC